MRDVRRLKRGLILAVVAAMVCRCAWATEFWAATSVLPAPEAVQAAAADETHFYAIANTQVAKYDRQTGKRVAVSTGEAKHLNSGFLREGKLYCAHSNYPQTPEKSEIKLLDVETMQLSTWKDFGNFGGSLTWAIWHEQHWWCHFARYGDDNGASFLVKFDELWNDKGRWSLPPEIVRELGRYSLSGGIWRDGNLLATGHDDPVVFRLKVPKSGTVLELVDRQKVPFTGQGIANDPATGGLVGIHRAQRQVVFAGRSLALRVLTYNIHHGEGIDRRLDLERIAQVIIDSKADLAALQEVDRKVARTNSVDQPAELARLTGLHAIFGGNIELQGGDYGNALLSRYPIRRHENLKLPCLENGEQRGVLDADVELPGGAGRLRIFATHLDHRPNDEERVASAKAINQLATRRADEPSLLLGDLNATSDRPSLVEFRKSWIRTNEQLLPTIPVDKPTRQIDYILYRPAGRWRVMDTQVLDEAIASDHRAVLSVIELLPVVGKQPGIYVIPGRTNR